MDKTQSLLLMLDEALNLEGRAMSFNRDTRLLNALPEMDSMAVVSVITTLEESWGLSIDDSEICAEIFATVGSLADFVEQKLKQSSSAQAAC